MGDQPRKLVFVDVSKDEGRVPNSKAIRRQIRKQAMHDAGLARKQRGGYGQHNLRQYPVFMSQGDPSFNGLTNVTDGECDPTAALLIASIPTKMPIGVYEKLRRDIDFDITQLSLITSLAFARGAARALASQPIQIAGILLTNNECYLNFLPPRYEDNPLLQDVLFCIATQSRCLLGPQSVNTETKILAIYGRALEHLQKALIDPDQCLHPDVLCATQILGIFEVLKFSRAERWQYHISGASQIVQNRGPARFKSEYELALLSSLIGALMSEAILNNHPFFLDQEEWKPVFESLALNDVNPFADRSKLSVSLWYTITGVPRLWKQVTDLICHRDGPNPGLAMELTLRAYKLRTDMKQWHKKFDAQVKAMPPDMDTKRQARELLCFSLAIRIVINRLIISLSPITSFAIEQEVQHFAKVVLNIKQEVNREPGTRCILFTHRFTIANSAVQTHAVWEEACRNVFATTMLAKSSEWLHKCLANKGVGQGLDDNGEANEQEIMLAIRPEDRMGVVPKWVFESWCSTLGRKTS